MQPLDADQKLAPGSPNSGAPVDALRRLMQVVSQPLLLMRADFTVEEANAAFLDESRLPAERLIGRSFLDVLNTSNPREANVEARAQINVEARAKLREALLAVQSTGKPQRLPLIRSVLPVGVGLRDGKREQFWSYHFTPLLDAQDRVEYIVMEAKDITDLHHWRRLLMRSAGGVDQLDASVAWLPTNRGDTNESDPDRQLLAQLFQQSPGLIGVLRGPQHIVVTANAGLLKLFGQHDPVGKPVREAAPEILTNGYAKLLDDVYLHGRVFVGRNLLATFPDALESEGSKIYFDLLLQPLLDERGEVSGIFIQGTDVTERKLAEDAFRQANAQLEERVRERTEQLLASQEQLRLFFDHSAECHGVLRVVDSGMVVFDELNSAVLRRFNRSREEVIGRTTDEVLGEYAEQTNAAIRECLRLRQPIRLEQCYGGMAFDVFAVPVPASLGQPIRVVFSAREVTESRKLEEQLRQAQKMEAVGQLTGGIAHDFNNLLTVIIGHLDRLERRLDQPELRTWTGYALESARSAAALTHRLLAFSRKQPLDPRPIDVNGLIVDMTTMLSRTLGETIVVETMLDPKLWVTNVDPHGVENALLNLALNARDAMPEGGMLSISTSNVWLEAVNDASAQPMTPGEYVRICVRDTGVGMAPEVLARAFEPFFTTKDVGHGSGLGLSMIYGFIQQSGGHINMESVARGGTTVEIYLPRLVETTAPSVIAEPSPTICMVPPKRVLVVEDDAAVRHFTVEALRHWGHEVLEAADGVDALRVLDQSPVDLLFTDIVLPGGLNGRQLAEQARAHQPEIKVLYTTGYDRGVLGADASASSWLAKPFTMDQLNARIAALFEAQ